MLPLGAGDARQADSAREKVDCCREISHKISVNLYFYGFVRLGVYVTGAKIADYITAFTESAPIELGEGANGVPKSNRSDMVTVKATVVGPCVGSHKQAARVIVALGNGEVQRWARIAFGQLFR